MEVNSSGFWDDAYRNNAPALQGALRRYVKDVNIVQDLLHEVFITAMHKYDGYTGKGSFEGWLYRITVNTALMHLRNERDNLADSWSAMSLLPLMDDDDANDTQADDARAIIEAAEFTGEELLAAIDRLPDHHKLVFNMYVMDDFSHKQIAAELNISPGTSKSHLARARKKIQQILYDDALNRKKKRERRWASAFLLLFPAKEHYIDRLYRDGLSNFTIPLTGGTGFLSTAIEQQTASVASVTVQSAAFWGSKLSYMAISCGTAAITGTACWLSMSVNSPLNTDNDRKINEIIVSDTLMYVPKPTEEITVYDKELHDSFHPSESLTTETSDPKESVAHDNTGKTEPTNPDADSSTEKTIVPVVIKKQIIQRQTVVVRDTIFIVE